MFILHKKLQNWDYNLSKLISILQKVHHIFKIWYANLKNAKILNLVNHEISFFLNLVNHEISFYSWLIASDEFPASVWTYPNEPAADLIFLLVLI